MAKFLAQKFDTLELDMKEVAEIPEDIRVDMLSAGAAVAVDAMRQSITRLKLVLSGQLRDSITATRKTDKATGHAYFLVYPKGTRRQDHTVTVSNVRRVKLPKSPAKKTTNNDVGFVQEFGSPRRNIKPKQWMRTAIEQSADKIVDAEYRVYDSWLKSKGF